jgi:RHS repeat-associated protein
MPTGHVSVGHPVDVGSGVVYTTELDISIAGSYWLEWERSYSTGLLDLPPSPIGPGWTCNLFSSLAKHGTDYQVTRPDGYIEVFSDPEGVLERGGVLRHLGSFLELSKKGGQYRLTRWNVETHQVDHYDFERSAHGDGFRLVSLTDRTGQGLDLDYDRYGRLNSVRQRLEGRMLLIDYVRENRISSVSLLLSGGRYQVMVEYEYDHMGRLVRIADPLGGTAQYEYDSVGRLTREIAKDGGVFSFDYDDQGRCVRTSGTDRYDEKVLRYYEATGWTEVRNSVGGVSRYQCMPSGQVIREIGPAGGVTVTEYDEHGRIVASIDPLGGATRFEYDTFGNRSKIIDPLGSEDTFLFDESHTLLQVVDRAGNCWKRELDRYNRIVATEDPYGNRWLIEYDKYGNEVAYTAPDGSQLRREFSPVGILVAEVDWIGHRTEFEVDEFNRIVLRRDHSGNAARYQFDVLGRILSIEFADGGRTSWAYDRAGNVIAQTDSNGNTTTFRYGPCRRLVERVDPTGGTVQYYWGTEPDSLLAIRNEKGELYRFELDIAGRVARETAFDGQTLRYTYDPAGRIIGTEDALGRRNSYSYDSAGRLVRRGLFDGSVHEFVRDAFGNVSSASNPDCAVSFDRDAYGRVVREEIGRFTVDREYDSMGNVVRVESNIGPGIGFAYNAAGWLERASANGTELLRIVRDPRGDEIARTIGKKAWLEQKFDAGNKLIEQKMVATAQQVAPFSGSPAFAAATIHRRYRFDGVGNLIREDDAVRGTTVYEYDPAERLVAADRSGDASERFAYDPCTNVTSMVRADGASQSLLYSQGSRLARTEEIRFEYDEVGNLTRRTDTVTGHEWTYRWDADNQLRSVITPDGAEWSYTYDPFGRRIRKQGPDVQIEYVWDEHIVLHEVSRDGADTTWIFDPHSFTPLYKLAGGEGFAVISDHLGSPRELVDRHGTVTWSATYSSWGQAYHGNTTSSDCPVRFPGHWFDEETGLHYNRFRYYDPSLGRYISFDPVGLIGHYNAYQYGWNPINWFDPFGWHANSRTSTSPNHVYMIVDTQTGTVHKYGISGRPLNQNGTSNRANVQVNRLNQTSPNRYRAVVLHRNVPGRAAALSIEQGLVDSYARTRERRGHPFEGPAGNRRPQPSPRPCP